MKYTKLLLGAVVLSSAMLAGCANDNTRLDQLSSDVQTLNARVDQLSTDVSGMRADVQSARDDAARANQRLDNMAHSYRK